MPVPSNPELVQFGDWKLRIRPATAEPKRLLLLIHGWTGDENSMWVFTRDLPQNRWIIAPRAPHVTEPSGFSWRLHNDGDQAPPGIIELQPSVDAILHLVDEYSAREGIRSEKFDVVGFSQGAALGIAIALHHPERIDRLGVLAGFVPRGAEEIIAKQPLKDNHIFMTHGTTDPLVPVDRARESVRLLEKAGAQVDYCEADVGHKVSIDCMRSLKAYLQK